MRRTDRRSTRLATHDYAAGDYFVTLCTHERECLFGTVADGAMHLNDLGAIVVDELRRTVEVRREITIDAFVVMPNHVHVILSIRYVGAQRAAPLHIDRGFPATRENVAPGSLGAVIRAFKSAVTKRIREATGRVDPVWQRGYHDHIIREHDDLSAYRRYIEMNPVRWAEDDENPARCGFEPNDHAPTGARCGAEPNDHAPTGARCPAEPNDHAPTGARCVGAQRAAPLHTDRDSGGGQR